MLLEEGVCYDQCVIFAKLYYPLPCFIPYSKAKFTCYSRFFLTSYFCIPVRYKEKTSFQKTKIMASGSNTSWEIDGETVETVSDFILGGSKITADGD